MSKWKNSIVGEGDEAPDQLMANPRNWRIHPGGQQDAVAGALQRIGWIQRVIVNETTGNVIDGHLRISMAISAGEKTVPVLYVKLTEEEEAIALATLDPLAAMAVADNEQLALLLAEIEDADGPLRQALDDLAEDGEISVPGPVDRGEPRPEFAKTIELRLQDETYFRWRARRAEYDTDDEFVTSLLDSF